MVTLAPTELTELLKVALAGKHPANAGEYALHVIYATGRAKDKDSKARIVLCENMDDRWPRGNQAPVLDWIALSLLSRDPGDRSRIPRYIAIHRILQERAARLSNYNTPEDAARRVRILEMLAAIDVNGDSEIGSLTQDLPGLCPYSLAELGADDATTAGFGSEPSSEDRLEYYRFYTGVTQKFMDYNKTRVAFILNGDPEHAPLGFEYAARYLELKDPKYWGVPDIINARELSEAKFAAVLRTWKPSKDASNRILGISKHATTEGMIDTLRQWCADRAAIKSRKGGNSVATPKTDAPGMSVSLGVLYASIGRSITAKEILALRSEHAPTVISELPWAVVEPAVQASRDELYAWALRWLGSNFDVSLAFSEHPERPPWFHEEGRMAQMMHEQQELWVSTATTVVAIRNEIADLRREVLQLLGTNQSLWDLGVYYHIILYSRARDRWVDVLAQIDAEAARRLPQLFDRQVELAADAAAIGFIG